MATSRTLLSLMSLRLFLTLMLWLSELGLWAPGGNLQLSPYLEDHQKISPFLINCLVSAYEFLPLYSTRSNRISHCLTLLPTDWESEFVLITLNAYPAPLGLKHRDTAVRQLQKCIQTPANPDPIAPGTNMLNSRDCQPFKLQHAVLGELELAFSSISSLRSLIMQWYPKEYKFSNLLKP